MSGPHVLICLPSPQVVAQDETELPTSREDSDFPLPMEVRRDRSTRLDWRFGSFINRWDPTAAVTEGWRGERLPAGLRTEGYIQTQAEIHKKSNHPAGGEEGKGACGGSASSIRLIEPTVPGWNPKPGQRRGKAGQVGERRLLGIGQRRDPHREQATAEPPPLTLGQTSPASLIQGEAIKVLC